MNEKQYTPFCDMHGNKIAVGDRLEVSRDYISGRVTSVGIVKFSEFYKDYVIAEFENGWADRFLGADYFRSRIVDDGK